MIIWEAGHKHEIGQIMVAALKALSVGYAHIRAAHAAYLGTFGLCYTASAGSYVITSDGKRALELWEQGHDYDCGTQNREHPIAVDRTALFDA